MGRIKGPQFERQLEQLKVEQIRLDLADKKMKSEAEQKKNDLDAQAASLKLIQTNMELAKAIHDREEERLRNAGPDAAEAIAVQRRESEQWYRVSLVQIRESFSHQSGDSDRLERRFGSK